MFVSTQEEQFLMGFKDSRSLDLWTKNLEVQSLDPPEGIREVVE